MARKLLYRVSAYAALILFAITLGTILFFGIENAGAAFILFFIALGVSFQGRENLKGFSYPTMIFGVLTLALYYPAPLLDKAMPYVSMLGNISLN